jgi:hypothetical protein
MINFDETFEDDSGIPKHTDYGDGPANLGRVSLYYWLVGDRNKANLTFIKGMQHIKEHGFVRHKDYVGNDKYKIGADQQELLDLFARHSGLKGYTEYLDSQMTGFLGLFFSNGTDIKRPHHIVFKGWKWLGGLICWLFARYRVWHWKNRPYDKHGNPNVSDDVNFYYILRWMEYSGHDWADKIRKFYDPLYNGPGGQSALRAYFNGDTRLSQLHWEALEDERKQNG